MDQDALDQIVRAAIRLDPNALTGLVGAFQDRVFGLAYRLTRSRETAEDITQETFLRMVRTIGSYAHQGRFEAWLFRIAANLARDHNRRRVRRGPTAELDGDESPHRSEASGDPAVLVADRESEEQLLACLAELPDMDREILLLRYFGELSFREIAEMLGLPLGTALARAHRATGKLREALKDDLP